MGAGAGIPNIAVRLSAEGVQDVVNAFARVRQEGKQTGQETSAGLNLITGSLESLTALLPALTLGAAVTAAVTLGENALTTAEEMEKLSLKTGISVGTLSVFAVAAREGGASTEALATGLIKLTKGQADGAAGVAKQAAGFKTLGISIQQINDLNAGQIFDLIASKIQSLTSVQQRNQALQAIFGKSYSEIVPVLEQLGTQGFDALEQKAKRFGVYIGGDFAQNAKEAQAGIADLRLVAEGTALQFTSGVLPAVTGVVNALADLYGGADGLHSWGQIVGGVVLDVASDFLELYGDIRVTLTVFDGLIAKAGSFGRLVQALNPGLTLTGLALKKGAETATANASDEQKQEIEAILETIAKGRQDIAEARSKLYAPAREGTGFNGGAPGSGITSEEQGKIDAAQSAYEQSLADNEIAIIKLRNSVEEAEDKRRYDAGLESLETYYANRQQRIDEAYKAELLALGQKDAAIAKLPSATAEQRYKKQTEQGKNSTARQELNINYAAQTSANDADEAAAVVAQRQKQLEVEKQLMELSGDRTGAEEKGLDIEIEKYEQLLKSQGKSVDEIAAASDAARTLGQSKIDFQTNLQVVQQQLQEMDAQVAAVNDAVANGQITQIAGQAQIHDIESKRIEGLGSIVELMTQQAALSKDPAQQQQLLALVANLAHVKASLQDVTTAQTYLINQVTTQGRQDFEDFFTAIADGSKTASQAFADLAADFEKIVAQMIAKLLVFSALEAVLGWINPDEDSLLGQYKSGLDSAGPFGKYAEGGWTGGKAGAAAGIVHGEEFVVKAGPAAAYRPLLEMINAGETPAIRTPSVATAETSDYVDGLHTGDSVTGSGTTTSPPSVVNVINATGQPSSQKTTQTTGGGSVTDVIIGTSATDIAKGGKMARALETTYGLQRVGVNRG